MSRPTQDVAPNMPFDLRPASLLAVAWSAAGERRSDTVACEAVTDICVNADPAATGRSTTTATYENACNDFIQRISLLRNRDVSA